MLCFEYRTISYFLGLALVLVSFLQYFVQLVRELDCVIEKHSAVFAAKLRHVLEEYRNPRDIKFVKVYFKALQDAIDEGIVSDAHLVASFDDVHQGSATTLREECIGGRFFKDKVSELLEALRRLI